MFLYFEIIPIVKNVVSEKRVSEAEKQKWKQMKGEKIGMEL